MAKNSLEASSSNPFRIVYREGEGKVSEERPEWNHLKYEYKKIDNHAFEFTYIWTVATAALIADAAFTWARKAAQCNLSLLPIPR